MKSNYWDLFEVRISRLLIRKSWRSEKWMLQMILLRDELRILVLRKVNWQEWAKKEEEEEEEEKVKDKDSPCCCMLIVGTIAWRLKMAALTLVPAAAWRIARVRNDICWTLDYTCLRSKRETEGWAARLEIKKRSKSTRPATRSRALRRIQASLSKHRRWHSKPSLATYKGGEQDGQLSEDQRRQIRWRYITRRWADRRRYKITYRTR